VCGGGVCCVCVCVWGGGVCVCVCVCVRALIFVNLVIILSSDGWLSKSFIYTEYRPPSYSGYI